MAKKADIRKLFQASLPPEVLEFFRKEGAKGGKIGGKIGGKRSLETMTPEARRARALKAVAAREAKRTDDAKSSSRRARKASR